MKSQGLKPLIVIVGPTGSGKSAWAERLADCFNGELITADSRQIYKEMSIGTNKSPAHLIDILEPGQEFSVAEYKKLALKTIKEIQQRGRLPILVGGTGLYVQAIVDNLKFPKAKPNKKFRARLKKSGLNQHQIRELEIRLSGASPGTKGRPLFSSLQIGIDISREKLYQRINKRVDEMLEQGLLEEREGLKKYKNLPKTIGYFESSPEKIKTNTRRYAKRQLTWFRRDRRINWLKTYKEAGKLVKEFLAKDSRSQKTN